MAKANYFYVLYCRDGSFYGGYTNNLNRRLKQHNQAKGAKYTRPSSRRPVKYLYAEAYPTPSLAMQAEYAFKQKNRRAKEKFLDQQGIHPPYKRINNVTINYEHMIAEEKHDDSKEFC